MIDSAARFGHAGVPQPDRRDHQALLEDAGGVAGHRARHGAADVVVVAEGLDERDDHARRSALRRPGEDRDRHAQVGQVPDAALGAVDVVVEEDVALPHLLDREVPGDRVHERGVRAAGQLAQQPVVDAGAEVVGVADHRAAAGAADRGLDLHLDAGQRALDDLDQHRVGARAGVVGQVAEGELGGRAPARGATARRRPSRDGRAHASLLRVTMMLRYSSMRAVNPGCSGTVEPNSSMIAGPVDDRAGGEVGAPQHRGVDVPVGGRRSRPAGGPSRRGGAPSPSG